MQRVSTKLGKFHPVGGVRKVEVHFGEPILAEKYLALPREEFLELVQRSIATARSSPLAARPAMLETAKFSASNPLPPAR
jgi:hypothetical protein